jgi:diacylglycerol kinase (ATP)
MPGGAAGVKHRFIDSVNFAIQGILHATRTQKHMRYHFCAAILLLVAVLFLRISALEFTVLCLSVAFVLFAEMINTAVEAIVDLVSPEYHPLAKVAKDVAAGAVLIAAFGTAVMGYSILAKYIFPHYRGLLTMIGSPGEMATLVSILIVVIVVIILKAFSGTGAPLQGGLPSGHAAVAFSIATSVSLNTGDPIISILTITLAVMVSHSRLLMHIHTLWEVIFGAVTGSVITLLITLLFRTIRLEQLH